MIKDKIFKEKYFCLGALCGTILTPCNSGPCAFGTCIQTGSTWTCACAPGWTGIQCKDGINECLSNPCLNAGICVDGVNEYSCVCLNRLYWCKLSNTSQSMYKCSMSK